MPAPRLVLASASPARLRTLSQAGIQAEQIVSGIDESLVDSTDAGQLSGTLARLKAEAVAGRLAGEAQPGTLVLGCDSVLAHNGQIFGKPGTPGEATDRWRQMRGTSGTLYTGHCLIQLDSDGHNGDGHSGSGHTGNGQIGKCAEGVAATIIHVADISDAEIDAYVRSGEPLEVAGGFTIDGLGGVFVDGIEGDPSNVIGVSLPLLRRLFADLGVSVTELWQSPR